MVLLQHFCDLAPYIKLPTYSEMIVSQRCWSIIQL